MDYQGKKPSGWKAGPDRTLAVRTGLKDCWLAGGAKFGGPGYSLTSCSGDVSSNSRTPKDCFLGRLQAVGAARLGSRTAATWIGCGQLWKLMGTHHLCLLPLGLREELGPGRVEGLSKSRSQSLRLRCQSVSSCGSWPWYQVSPLKGRRRPSQAWGTGPVVWGVDVSIKSGSAT